MAKITLTVTAVTENARSDIKKLQEYAVNVFSNPIQIKFESGALESIKNQLSAITKTPANIQIDTSSVQAARGEITKYSETIVQGAQASKRSITEMRIGVGEYVKTIKDASETGSQVTKQHIINYDEQRKAAEKAAREQERSAQAAQKAREKELEALVKAARAAEDSAEKKAKAEEDALIRTKKAILKEQQQYEAAQEREAEAAERANQRAAASISTLDKQYSDLIRQINTLKSQYPEGTFDAIEREAREAQGAVRGLDTNASDLAAQVQALQQQLNGLKAGFSAARTETQKLDKVTESLWMNLQKFARWWIVGGIITTITRSFREAFETIKAVDSELVTIRKTTDFNEQQIAALTEKTYELASAYGRTADELLNLSSTFARAGMGDQIEEMTELGALLENVGDIEGNTAAKFILAANAAWKLGGDYNALMEIIDGMNAVTNQAAVDMEALTTGITVAGSVFANAGETAQTYTAMVGTAVAATQRSGSEVARGLRTIAMNIRSIKGELEDGEIIDEESISDAADALHSVGISVADAKGELRLTSDVLDDLAGKWNSLTTAEQAYLAESLAGKRQANILTALMQNWSEVERQMTLYANGAGSALKENELYLDSWEAKSKKLSAAWTEFISHLIDSKVVKTALDALTGVVKVLDTDFGRGTITVLAFTAALMAIPAAFSKIKAALSGSTFIQGLTALVSGFITTVTGLTTATEAFTVVWNTSPFVVVAAAAAVIYGIASAIDALTVTISENADSMRENLENYKEVVAEIDNLNAKIEENKSLIEKSNEAGGNKAYRERLEEENKRLEQQVTILRQREALELRTAAGKAVNIAEGQYEPLRGVAFLSGIAPDTSVDLSTYFSALKKASEAPGAIAADAKKEFDNLVDSILDARDTLLLYEEARGALTESQREALELFDLLIGAYAEESEFISGKVTQIDLETEAIEEEIDVLKQLNDEIDNVQSALKTVREAQDEYNQSGEISVETLQALLQLEPEYLAALIDENGQINLNSEAVSTLIDGKNVLLERLAAESVATYAAKEAERLLAEQEGNAGTAAETAAGKLDIASSAASLLAENAIKGASGVTALDISLQKLAGKTGLKKNYAKELIDNVSSYAAALSGAIGSTSLGLGGWAPSSSGSSRSGGGSSGSSAGSDKDPELERLKDAVALEKQRLSFLETSNASEEEQIAKMREVQDALHAQADYLRSIGASEKDILALSTEWWQYQNKIDKLLEDAAKKAQEAAEAEAKALREGIASTLEGITEELEKQAELATSPLQEELDALKAAHDLRKEDTEEAEKLLAVEKARIALENAERERNVRVYNAKTGQWEWVANAQTVASARENLTAAQKALDDFYAENAYNAKVKALEERIENTSSAFKELIKAITDAAKAVRDGSMSGDEAYAGIGAAMEGIDPIYRQGLAGALIGRMKANSAAWHDAGPDERAELEAQNLAIGTSLGWHRGADGVWYDAVGSRAYDRWTDADVVSPFGFGSAVSGTGYDAMLRSMGIVTSAGGAGGGYAGGSGGTSIGEQHNGDVYQIGGVTLTEGQARGMTVFDLVQMAGGLALHGG